MFSQFESTQTVAIWHKSKTLQCFSMSQTNEPKKLIQFSPISIRVMRPLSQNPHCTIMPDKQEKDKLLPWKRCLKENEFHLKCFLYLLKQEHMSHYVRVKIDAFCWVYIGRVTKQQKKKKNPCIFSLLYCIFTYNIFIWLLKGDA